MNPFFALFTVTSLVFATAVHAEDIYSVKETPISMDEKRQQAILGVREFRCSYSMPDVPDDVQIIVESFVGGELQHRYRSIFAPNFGRKAGTVSLAWIAKDREMITVIDTGHPYSPFSKRQLIDAEDFDEPVDPWFFSKCEKRHGMIPLFGICGQRTNKMGSVDGKFDAPQQFIAACGNSGARFTWIVYLYIGGDNPGGWPVFEDGK